MFKKHILLVLLFICALSITLAKNNLFVASASTNLPRIFVDELNFEIAVGETVDLPQTVPVYLITDNETNIAPKDITVDWDNYENFDNTITGVHYVFGKLDETEIELEKDFSETELKVTAKINVCQTIEKATTSQASFSYSNLLENGQTTENLLTLKSNDNLITIKSLTYLNDDYYDYFISDADSTEYNNRLLSTPSIEKAIEIDVPKYAESVIIDIVAFYASFKQSTSQQTITIKSQTNTSISKGLQFVDTREIANKLDSLETQTFEISDIESFGNKFYLCFSKAAKIYSLSVSATTKKQLVFDNSQAVFYNNATLPQTCKTDDAESQFIGWSDGSNFVETLGNEDKKVVYPIFAKPSPVKYSIRIGERPGVRYCLELELSAKDKLSEQTVSENFNGTITLTAHGQKPYTLAILNHDYDGKTIFFNAVITDFESAYNETGVAVQSEFYFNEKIFNVSAKEHSAKEIAGACLERGYIDKIIAEVYGYIK